MQLNKFHIEVQLIKSELRDDGSIADCYAIDTKKMELGYSKSMFKENNELKEQTNANS